MEYERSAGLIARNVVNSRIDFNNSFMLIKIGHILVLIPFMLVVGIVVVVM